MMLKSDCVKKTSLFAKATAVILAICVACGCMFTVKAEDTVADDSQSVSVYDTYTWSPLKGVTDDATNPTTMNSNFKWGILSNRVCCHGIMYCTNFNPYTILSSAVGSATNVSKNTQHSVTLNEDKSLISEHPDHDIITTHFKTNTYYITESQNAAMRDTLMYTARQNNDMYLEFTAPYDGLYTINGYIGEKAISGTAGSISKYYFIKVDKNGVSHNLTESRYIPVYADRETLPNIKFKLRTGEKLVLRAGTQVASVGKIYLENYFVTCLESEQNDDKTLITANYKYQNYNAINIYGDGIDASNINLFENPWVVDAVRYNLDDNSVDTVTKFNKVKLSGTDYQWYVDNTQFIGYENDFSKGSKITYNTTDGNIMVAADMRDFKLSDGTTKTYKYGARFTFTVPEDGTVAMRGGTNNNTSAVLTERVYVKRKNSETVEYIRDANTSVSKYTEGMFQSTYCSKTQLYRNYNIGEVKAGDKIIYEISHNYSRETQFLRVYLNSLNVALTTESSPADINGDFKLTDTDTELLNNYLLGFYGNETDLHYDVNLDGATNVYDLIKAKKIVLGLDDETTEDVKPKVRISSSFDALPDKMSKIQIELSDIGDLKGGYEMLIQFPEIAQINSVSLNGKLLNENKNYSITEENILTLCDTFNVEVDAESDSSLMWNVSFTVASMAELENYPVTFYKKPIVADINGNALNTEAQDGCIAINVDEASLLGDTDGDGSVSAVDITLMRKQLIDKASLDFCAENSDLNRDGSTNLKDLVSLKKYLVSIAVEFVATGIDADCQYIYNGNGYTYAITKDGKEIISFSDNGKYIDVLEGAGEFVLYGDSKNELLRYNGIKTYETAQTEKGTLLTVTYNVTGDSLTDCVAQTEYLFHNGGISIVSNVSANTDNINIKSGIYDRKFINAAGKTDKKLNYKWIYPENGDYPYQETESMVTVSYIDNTHCLYTFNRDEQLASYYYLKTYPAQDLPVYIKEGNSVSYEMKYDLAFADTDENKNYDRDALFGSLQSDFAVKIDPDVKNDDNSTVFLGDSVKLNINLQNIANDDISYNLKYDVKDYYGNTVAEENITDGELNSGDFETLGINVSGKYGIYYLNLNVSSNGYSYTEYYPFMLVKDYTYKYKDSIPFGIDALHRNSILEENTSVSLCDKLGVGIVRVGSSIADVRLAKKLYNSDIKTFVGNGGTLENEKSVEKLISNWNLFKDYCEWFTFANETDYSVKGNYEACKNHMNDYFIPKYFNDLAKKAITDNNIPVSWCASCHGNSQWSQVMYESGVWDASNVIDTHLYCYPKNPDKKYIYNGANEMHSIEYGLQRIKDSMDKYGKGDKLLVIGETGYPTSGGTSVDIRTQADFNTRVGILSLAYGADYISYYCMYDRTSYYTGADSWSEMNFGAFYCYDYYGITKPKPWAAAYANMSRQLDGVNSAQINTKYDNQSESDRMSSASGTVRAFSLTTKDNRNIMVAWSNISPLPNTTSVGVSAGVQHNPTLPWENQWKGTENVTFDAVKNTVEVVDTMGNSKFYDSVDGKVTIPLTGSPVYIYGVE